MHLSAAALVAAFFMAGPAYAHDWYSKKVDPVHKWSCCGGHDCAVLKLEPGVITAEPEGYRIRLTLQQAQQINPYAMDGIDAVVAWDRVQPSETNDWHLCIASAYRGAPGHGIYCLFEPPSI